MFFFFACFNAMQCNVSFCLLQCNTVFFAAYHNVMQRFFFLLNAMVFFFAYNAMFSSCLLQYNAMLVSSAYHNMVQCFFVLSLFTTTQCNVFFYACHNGMLFFSGCCNVM